MTVTEYQETVFIVDDDEAVREALGLLMQSAGLTARTFSSGDDFLAACSPTNNGCALLDVRMPGMSGMVLQEKMQERGIDMPVIFLTGHGDVPMAVKALKNGALDFFQKPVNDEQLLLDRVQEALLLHRKNRERIRKREQLRERLSQLTRREHEIAGQVAAGKANKVIAIELGISERTVELHRSRVMHKLGLRSVTELVRLLGGGSSRTN